MKAKSLITDNDFVVNPTKPVTGDKIPVFAPPVTAMRGMINYGKFLATEMANRRAKPILNALVTYFFADNGKDRENAEAELKGFAEQYKEE